MVAIFAGVNFYLCEKRAKIGRSKEKIHEGECARVW